MVSVEDVVSKWSAFVPPIPGVPRVALSCGLTLTGVDVVVLVEGVIFDTLFLFEDAHDIDAVVEHALHDLHRREGVIGNGVWEALDEIGQCAAMINVGVGHDYRVG